MKPIPPAPRISKFAARIATLALAVCFLGSGPLPPPPPPGSDSDTYFGVNVPDPYRAFENPKNPELLEYFKAQNAYTRSVLDALPGRSALATRIAQLDGTSESLANLTVGRHAYFYLRRPIGASALRLYERASAGGAEHLVLDPDRFARTENQHFTIDFYSPSLDDRLVGVGVSEGGSEVEVLRFVEVATGRVLSERIDRTPYIPPTWRSDGRSFYYFRTPKLPPGAPQSARDTKGQVLLHVLGTNPDRDRPIFGYGYAARIPFAPEDAAQIILQPGTPWALAVVQHGVQNEIAVWIAPRSALEQRSIPWRQVVRYSDNVTGAGVRKGTLYALSHQRASRFGVLAFELGTGDAAHARVVVAESARVIGSIAVARDALYLDDLDRGLGRVRRAAFGSDGIGPAVDVPLPFAGAIGELDADSRSPGAVFNLEGWTHSPQWYAIASVDTVTDTGLRRPSPVDFSAITSEEVNATSADGTSVPLSIVRRKDLALDGSHPTLVDGYGAYGIVISPSFSATRLAWLERGAVFAECHPRGGGELGNDWHFAAHIATKQRTIDDFIGCARYLVDHHYTTSERLAGMGTSAGGVTIGNAIIQQPALFAAAIDNVGDTNGVRDEYAEGGPANIPEFGTNKDPVGFKALFATDAYVQMKPNVAYPAVLAITGVNDPRVAPWIVAKFIAKLQNSTTSGKPVLLRVDFDAGHGLLGSSREQVRAFYTDMYAFLFWQLGDPAFAIPNPLQQTPTASPAP
jgi:prolyl oligopeptidase